MGELSSAAMANLSAEKILDDGLRKFSLLAHSAGRTKIKKADETPAFFIENTCANSITASSCGKREVQEVLNRGEKGMPVPERWWFWW